MGIPPDSAGRGGGGLGGTEGGATGGERSTEKEVSRVGAEHAGVTVIDQSVDWNASFASRAWSIGCCIPGLQIGVGRSSKRHGGDLTLDIQFESAAEFDYQGPGVRVSSVRG